MTAAELGELLGVSAWAVRHARARFGRYDSGADGLCRRCEDRPVWGESPRARKMGLCKGCYLEEMRKRLAEEREGAAVRQARKRSRERGGNGRKD